MHDNDGYPVCEHEPVNEREAPDAIPAVIWAACRKCNALIGANKMGNGEPEWFTIGYGCRVPDYAR
jgi:hypothetical protein